MSRAHRLAAIASEACRPSGRCNRKALAELAVVLLLTQIAAALLLFRLGADELSPGALLTSALLLWPTTTLVIKRLHDVGRSARSLLWAVGGVIAWSTLVALVLVVALGDAAVQPGGLGLFLAQALTTLPVLGLVVWLHFARGEPQANRYGPMPAGFGLAPDSRRGSPLAGAFKAWIAAGSPDEAYFSGMGQAVPSRRTASSSPPARRMRSLASGSVSVTTAM
jgi:uncharacterized membrane protein YhaH (DUF805 family)